MPRTAAGCDNLEHARRETQARDVTSVETNNGQDQHSFVSVTSETQINSVTLRLVERMCGALYNSGAVMRRNFVRMLLAQEQGDG